MSRCQLAALLSATLFLGAVSGCQLEPPSVLVFSYTQGYRHASIEPGIEAMKTLGTEKGFDVTATEDPTLFTDSFLSQFDAIVFLSTTGDILNPQQQTAFQRYIQAGGGFVGIHSATDTEFDWPWYGQFVGGYFAGHPGGPNVREGRMIVVDSTHPATSGLPAEWIRPDEFYDFRNQYDGISVLLNIDESTYKRPDENPAGEPRPIAWYNNFDGGRMFYTALGHTPESWAEDLFIEHVWGGLQYALGPRTLDYSRPGVVPEDNRFKKSVLDRNLDEPMELDFLDDDQIVFVERRGSVKIHRLSTGQTTVAGKLEVSRFGEEGLLGVAVDPKYADNHWIYLAYSDPVNMETHLARFVLDGETLDYASEKRLLSFPVERDKACCHMGGSLEFDKNGNLYLSVGDNTNPFESAGFDPIDERPGRRAFDAQRSSGNPMDLRGKVIRIKPQDDGTYTIPAGNLFSSTDNARPEIYVMGNRNPFRLSIDDHTGYLYWGEVGPDASNDGPDRGPRGYDEINQARTAGFFGWPYVIANNKPYNDFSFSSNRSGTPFNPASIENDSPNNSGLRKLPPAQPAFIWYPYDKSSEFPNLGSGGRTAMAGPVFYSADYAASEVAFPEYYNGRLFIYDWVRDWIAVVTMDEQGNRKRVDRFMESNLDLSNPIDMVFARDGSMYVLEYGASWNTRNLDARLSRITYNGGNRAPTAVATASAMVGAVPLTVNFSSVGSIDSDGGEVRYEWDFDGDGTIDSRDASPSHTFVDPGTYRVSLTVRDEHAATDVAELEVWPGNSAPTVSLQLDGNRSFFFPTTSLTYSAEVEDLEDGSLSAGSISPTDVTVTLSYLAEGHDLIATAVGHQSAVTSGSVSLGETLIGNSDCLSCHQAKDASNGPPFKDVALRYASSPDARDYLISKIINGGSGIWGDRPMVPHPTLDPLDVGRMVDYIRSLASDEASREELGDVRGTVRFTKHKASETNGRYILTASYQDRGNSGLPSLSSTEQVVLRSPAVEAESLESSDTIVRRGGVARGNGWLLMPSVDLTTVTAITVIAAGEEAQGTVRVHLDDADGIELGRINASEMRNRRARVALTQPVSGMHDLHFVLSGFSEATAGIDQFVFGNE